MLPLDIQSLVEGAALFVSIAGSLSIEQTMFSYCSTSSYARALSCMVTELVMKQACFYECFSTKDCLSNTYHAAKIIISNAQGFLR